MVAALFFATAFGTLLCSQTSTPPKLGVPSMPSEHIVSRPIISFLLYGCHQAPQMKCITVSYSYFLISVQKS